MPPPGLLGLITRGASALGQRLAQGGAPAQPAVPSPFEIARRNALINPNMPIEAGFQTPSAKANADLELQARRANQLAAGRAAIIERARAQGRQVNVDPNTGQLVIGDVPPDNRVQTIGGQRFAFDAQGRPVGMAGGAISPPRVEGQTTPTVLTPEQALANRQRIADALASAIRRDTAPAVAASVAAPVAAAPTVAPTPAPVAAAPLPNDIPSVAAEASRRSGLLGQVTGAMPGMAQASPEQALAQAEQFIAEEPTKVAIEEAQVKGKTHQQQVAETTRELTRARIRRDLATVRRLSSQLDKLLKSPPRSPEETKTLMEREPMWIGP